MSAVRPVGELALQPVSPADTTTLAAAPKVGQVSFADVFGDAIADANAKQIEAARAAEAFAAGARDDIHGTMIAVKEAEIELKMVSSVRNKLLDAWNDLWRMSV